MVEQFSGGVAGFAVLTVLGMMLGLFSTIFWMVMGGCAVRAFEKVADSVENLARGRQSEPGG